MNDPLFQMVSHIAKITDGEWQAMAALFRPRKIAKGETLMLSGEVCDFVAFVDSGLMRLYTVRDGVDRTSEFIAARDFVTDYHSFLTRQPSPQTIGALADSELRLISYRDLQSLYQKMPVFERVGRLIAEAVFQRAVERFSSMMNQKPEERYVKFIEQYPLVNDMIPQYMAASYVGVTPVGLSKIRKRLESQKKS